MVTVKLFGVLRLDAGWSVRQLKANTVTGVFVALAALGNRFAPGEVLIYVNQRRCTRISSSLNDGDEIWLMNAASGG